MRINARMPNYTALPHGLRVPMERWVEHGELPQVPALQHILTNNLHGAYASAMKGAIQWDDVYSVIAWLHNEAPPSCWGGRDSLVVWQSMNRREHA